MCSGPSREQHHDVPTNEAPGFCFKEACGEQTPFCLKTVSCLTRGTSGNCRGRYLLFGLLQGPEWTSLHSTHGTKPQFSFFTESE